ncbi:MAG TPA: cation diffusion facilitator family transporter [Acidobacteriota bacterium]|jgi:cation diffusion facilitator family transporter
MFAGSNLKSRTARLAVTVAALLAVAKLAIGIWMNSVTVMATAADSLLDMFASVINFLSIRKAQTPPDREHPFGHGKAESLAGLFQFLAILFTSLVLGWQAYRKLLAEGPTLYLPAGIAVLAASSVASGYVAYRLRRVGKDTESLALIADSIHYRMDVFTNVGAMAGLLIIMWRQWHWVDAAISLVISVAILAAAVRVGLRSVDELMDRNLPDETRVQIDQILAEFKPDIISYHNLRTRKSGSHKFIDLHIVIPADYPFGKAHRLTEEVMARIQRRIPNSDVMIHTDPAGEADLF